MSSCIREIVTLQIGHYSNFIGSHWLNLQEASFVYNESTPTDINHDILFRDGKLPNNQECYIPRLLIIDGKGSLGSLPQLGTLYGTPPPPTNLTSSHAFWGGKVDLFSHPPEHKNEFLKALEADDVKFQENIDEDKDVCFEDCESTDPSGKECKIFDLSGKVNVWSDFLRPHLHPKTIFLLEDVLHHEMGNEPNDVWGFADGVNVFKRQKTEEEVVDRIRLLSESCESMQGFQLLCDIHDGMAGVGTGLLQCLADDYSSKDVFTFAPCPPCRGSRNSVQMSLFLTNIIQAYTEFSNFSTLVLPLNLNIEICQPASDVVRWPHISYKETCAYETSSIFASFLETISVCWRTKSEPIAMTCLADVVTPLRKKVVSGCFACPIGLSEDSFLRDWLGQKAGSGANTGGATPIEYRSVGVDGDRQLPRVVEISTIRGIAKNRLESGPKRVKFDNAWQLYEHFLRKDDEMLRRSVNRVVFGARDPLITSSPFPQIFTDDVADDGFLKAGRYLSTRVNNVSAAASLHQGEGVLLHLEKLAGAGARINVTKLPTFTEGDMRENWKNSFEAFLSISDGNRGSSHFSDNTDSD